MKISSNGIAIIKEFEGCKLSAYHDVAGIATIGYGCTTGVCVPMTITLDQAVQMLVDALETPEAVIEQVVKVTLNQNQYDALVVFTYNVGSGNLSSSTLLRLLNQGNYTGAAAQFPRWNRAKGVVVDGLTRRRLAEQALFNTPVDATAACAASVDTATPSATASDPTTPTTIQWW